MENTDSKLTGPKQALERHDKLKVFGIMSAKKTVPEESLKKDFALSILITYTLAEAQVATRHVLKTKGLNPDDYTLDCMHLSVPVEEIVSLPTPQVTEAPKDETLLSEAKAKTVEEHMIKSARLLFSTVATTAEKKMLEKVIENFNNYNKEKHV